jgi:protein O-GlcNAc transferase
MHMLNRAVALLEEGECYLEVGTWRGATIIGALLGSSAAGYAIDNDVMDEHDGDEKLSREVWQENVRAFGVDAHYIDGTVPDVFVNISLPPIGVYLFDGDKGSKEVAYEGIVSAVPFLSPHALLFIDDANEVTIRQAVHQFQIKHFPHVKLVLDIPTPGNCWSSFWNGLMILQWDAEVVL